MTARQVIEEIKGLSPRELAEVRSYFQQVKTEQKPAGEVRYADPDAALKVADRIFTERAELFRKLAQ